MIIWPFESVVVMNAPREVVPAPKASENWRLAADAAKALASTVPESVSVCPSELVVVITPPVANIEASSERTEASLLATEAAEREEASATSFFPAPPIVVTTPLDSVDMTSLEAERTESSD